MITLFAGGRRHFADQREVLFGGQDILAGLFSDAIRTAPPSATAAQRRAVIAAHNDLQERQLLKRARIASAIAEALRARGADDTSARLTAEMGVLAFSTA